MLAPILAGCEAGQESQAGVGERSSGSRIADARELELAAIRQPSAVEIKQAQTILASLGYDPGPVDGVLGKKTKIAIKHFQVDEEVRVDGELTPRIMTRLKRAASKRTAVPESARQAAAGELGPATSTAVTVPVYEAGDTYIYTNGRVETVSRVGPEQVLWEGRAGNSYTASRNFILPPITWQSGDSSGENRIEPSQGEKWPPATNKPISFSVASRASGSSVFSTTSWSGKWKCETGAPTKVKAIAGTFDAITIVCHRHKPAPGTWKTRTWYFAPTVGHYVRRTDTLHGTDRKFSVDLIAIQPGGKGWPAAARGGLDWAVQGALDMGTAGKTVEWQSSAVGAAFQIRVGDKVRAPEGAVCRRYSIERNVSDQIRLFPAIACKYADQERWTLPGLEAGGVSPAELKSP